MKNKKIIRAVTVSKSVVFFVPIVRDLQNFGFEIVAISSPGIELYKLNELGVKPIAVTMKSVSIYGLKIIVAISNGF